MSVRAHVSGKGAHIAVFTFNFRRDVVLLKGGSDSYIVADGAAMGSKHGPFSWRELQDSALLSSEQQQTCLRRRSVSALTRARSQIPAAGLAQDTPIGAFSYLPLSRPDEPSISQICLPPIQ